MLFSKIIFYSLIASELCGVLAKYDFQEFSQLGNRLAFSIYLLVNIQKELKCFVNMCLPLIVLSMKFPNLVFRIGMK